MSGWVLKRVNKRLSDVPHVPWDWTERENPAFEDAKECVHRRVTNEGVVLDNLESRQFEYRRTVKSAGYDFFFFSLYIARSSGHTRQSQTTSQSGGPVQALTLIRWVARYAASPPPSPFATPLKTLSSRPTGPSLNHSHSPLAWATGVGLVGGWGGLV